MLHVIPTKTGSALSHHRYPLITPSLIGYVIP